jgi:hypothetical protein
MPQMTVEIEVLTAQKRCRALTTRDRDARFTASRAGEHLDQIR